VPDEIDFRDDSVDASCGGEVFFLAQLEAIERAIAFTCRRALLASADAEDFASFVKLKLIENDYSTLRKFEHRCSFAAYISVVVQRLLLDYRVHLWGKWHASAEAKRLGEAAIAVESMLFRDGMTIVEALPALRRKWPELTEERVHDIVLRLPQRSPRPRTVELETAYDAPNPFGVNETSLERTRVELAHTIATVVRETMQSYSDEDRLLFRLRFEGGVSIVEISRILAVEQKPLYRRLQRLLSDLRVRLRRRGVEAGDAEEVIGSGGIGFDFGFEKRTPPPCPSNHEGSKRGGEDEAS
jgi:RNA polymerase sigma factor (sigma-70 family)